jgi:hypothetical protein
MLQFWNINPGEPQAQGKEKKALFCFLNNDLYIPTVFNIKRFIVDRK